MKRKTSALTRILVLLLSIIAGIQFFSLVEANPIGAELEYTTPPIVSIHSPLNNETFPADVLLHFTVVKPDFWLKHGGYNAQQILKSVRYQLDGKYSDQIPVNSDLESPFDYSVNLKNLTDGVHSLKVYAYASGWFIEMHGFWEYEVTINSSSNVYFTVDSTPPTVLVFPVENKTYDKSDVALNFTVNEPVSQIAYSLDGQVNVTIAGNTTLTGLSEGTHNLTVYATDEAGNTGASEAIYFSVEVPEPLSTTMVIAPIASVAVAGIGLLFYFKKNSKGRL